MTASGEAIFAPSQKRNLNDPSPSILVHNLLRDSITLPTWIALGAVLQSILLVLPIRRSLVFAPAAAWIVVTITSEAMTLLGWTRDSYAARALQTKYSAVFPAGTTSGSSSVDTRDTPGGGRLGLFFLGFSSNHPLGQAAPGAKDVGDYYNQMMIELEKDAATNGYLGNTTLLHGAEQTRNTSVTNVFYFKTMDDVRKYAASPTHAKTVQWWAKHSREYPWLGIMHELYQVEQGSWENIYVNHPPTLFAATKHVVQDDEGRTMWASPIVDARKGRMSTTQGRLGRASK